MVLEMKNKNHISLMLSYGKVKGTILLNKYFPELMPFNNIFIISELEEWNNIKNNIPERLLFRADNKIGDKPVFISGANGDKNEIPEFIQKIKEQNENGVLIIFESKNSPSQRYTLNGGFNIGVSLGNNIFIDFVGKGFDGRELTKGIACHESYNIPWDHVIFCNNRRKLNAYKIYEVVDKEYKISIEERIEFFKSININEKKVRQNIPSKYNNISDEIITKILNKIVLPLYCKSEELSCDKLYEFAIAGNIDGDKLIPFEIYRPERIIQKK